MRRSTGKAIGADAGLPPGARLTMAAGRRYSASMTIEELRKHHQARPFKAFDVCLADGRAFPVEHPEFLAQSPLGRTIVITLDDGTSEIIDLPMVTSLKGWPNGHKPRRRRR